MATEYELLLQLLKDERPDAVIHFAEQRAAPYSQKGAREKRYTVDNNIRGTHNLCVAVVESGLDIHVCHLGTMGMYNGLNRSVISTQSYNTGCESLVGFYLSCCCC